MTSRLLRSFAAMAACISAVAFAAPAPTSPGIYRDWHDVDEVRIIQPFVAAAYGQIAVESFDSSRVKLPPTNENTYGAVQSAIRMMKPAFMNGLGERAQRKTSPN